MKSAYGTTRTRPVWFTIADGVLSEIAFPTVDLLQTGDTYLVVRNTEGLAVDERKCEHVVTRQPHTLAYDISSRCPGFTMLKTITANPSNDSVIADYRIHFTNQARRQIALIHNITAGATAGGDGLRVVRDGFNQPSLIGGQIDIRGDEPKSVYANATQTIAWTLSPSDATVGFEGTSSPSEFIQSLQPFPIYDIALFGNVAGALFSEIQDQDVHFQVTISFTETSMLSPIGQRETHQLISIDDLVADQQREWQAYLAPLKYDHSDSTSESSILVLKALEDKQNPGALIAAPGNPGIPWQVEASEMDYEASRLRRGDSNSGYRRTWPRDLYHKALSFLAVDDVETPLNSLRWFRTTQLPDGSWSQNMWVDGQPSWRGFQIDETALPIALAWRLAELGKISYPEYRDMVRRGVAVILQRGPGTGQERWEEIGGLSPNSMASTIEGLLAASQLEKMSGGDLQKSRLYADKANEWLLNLKTWLLIPKGHFGERYISRLEIGHNGLWAPDIQDTYHIANKADWQQKVYREDEILDGGFLEFILAGLVNPQDPDFVNTIALYDRHVRKQTIHGLGYIRYNQDSFGANHAGGAWPLLSAERAIVALEQKEPSVVAENLRFVQAFANEAGMICEQDTLSVCPLGWSHAAYLIMRRSIEDGRSFYIPRSQLP